MLASTNVSGVTAQCTPGSCDDNNPCTVDTCDPLAGCIHTPTNCDDGLRGNIAALPVGSSAGGEVCFENRSTPALVDPAIPAPGAGFWHLSQARNPCGHGPIGTQSNGALRVTGTCP